MEFNEKPQNLRKKHNLTQEQLAESDNRARRFTLISLLFGIYDIILISFIFTPLYGEKIGDYVRAVNLLQWTTKT